MHNTHRNSGSFKRWCAILAALLGSLALISCGSTSAAPFGGSNALPGVTVQISPGSASVTTGSVQPFTATVGNTSLTTVSWLVNGIVGGNAFVGTIDSNGNYTAPLYVPIPNVVTVTAAANADNSKQANASVTLSGTPLPVKVSPPSVNLYYGGIALLTASVALPNTAVTWEVAGAVGGNAAYGTVTPLPGNEDQAIYVAPLTSNQSQIPVSAVSVAENQYFGSATILLSSPPADSPVVTLTPAVNATVPTGWIQKFQATVTKTQNTGVSWSVDGIAGGNASVGTIVPGPDNTAVFTSPAQVPTPNLVYVTAASDALAEDQATTTVTVTQAPPLQVKISQNDVCQNLNSVGAGGQVQFTAAVTGAPNQGVTWGVNQVPGGNSTYGTITSTGLYTAPSTIPSNPKITIDAVSQLDNKTTGTLPLVLAAVPTAAVTISPTSATVETCPTCNDLVKRNSQHSRKGKKFQSEDQYPQGVSFTATSQFSGANPNYEVSWSLTNNGQDNGAIYPQPPQIGALPCQSSANYQAPPTVPNPGTINVTATSAADQQASASATVTIQQGPPFSVPPLTPQQATVQQGGTAQFTAYVYENGVYNPSVNQNVIWTLSSAGLDCSAAGNPCGTVNPTSGNGQTGYQGVAGTLYTAPPIITQNLQVTLTATAEVDPAASNNATINAVLPPNIALLPASAGCPADAGSGNSPNCTSGSSVVSFTVSATNLPPDLPVFWEMSCISLHNDYDECKSTYFEKGSYNNNYDGPGCISVPGQNQLCEGNGGFQNQPENEALTYLPPQNLFGPNYTENQCSQQYGNDGNGYLFIQATVGQNNICGPLQNSPCLATACIRICPAGTQNCTAP